MNAAFLFLDGFLNRWLDLSPPVWISALVAAVVVAIAAVLWKMLVSRPNRLLYPIPVAGSWTTKLKKDSAMADHESARLYQFRSRVWGQTKTKSNDPQTNRPRRYRIRGRITGEKLCMIYREITGTYLDTGAVLLQIKAKDGAMIGYEIGLDLETNNILPREYEWMRAGQ